MKICWAQYLLWFVIATLGVGGALTACGQKGALYRPVVEPAPAPAVADAPELAAPADESTATTSTPEKP